MLQYTFKEWLIKNNHIDEDFNMDDIREHFTIDEFEELFDKYLEQDMVHL